MDIRLPEADVVPVFNPANFAIPACHCSNRSMDPRVREDDDSGIAPREKYCFIRANIFYTSLLISDIP